MVLIEGNEFAVETNKTDKGAEVVAGLRQGPVSDQVEFGFGRRVAVDFKVIAEPFKALAEEVTLLWVERQAVTLVSLADTTEMQEAEPRVGVPEQAIIHNCFDTPCSFGERSEVVISGADVLGTRAIVFTVVDSLDTLGTELIRFAVDNLHDGSVNRRGVHGPEGHDGEAELF